MANETKSSKALQLLGAFAVTAALAAALAWYYDAYVNWNPEAFPLTIVALTLGVVALTLLTLWARGERKPMTLAWKTMLSVFVFTGVIILGISAIINNVIGHQRMAEQAAAAALPMAASQILALLVLLLRARRKGKALTALLLALVFPVTGIFGFALPYYMRNIYKAPVPALAEGQFAPMPELGEVDFTVPTDGSIEEVRDLIREARGNGDEKHFTVLIEDGEYNITQLAFDERDHDTTYRSRDGGVILSGGLRLDPKDFTVPGDDVLARLSAEARENVRMIDLTALGLGPEDWGKMYSFGAFTSAAKYDDGEGPLPCELFCGGRRMTTARYPNGDAWLELGKVLDMGDTYDDYGDGTENNPEWQALRSPRGGTFAMDKETAGRAVSWATLDDVWMFGCFKWDWADMATPVQAVDDKKGTVTTRYASCFGFEKGRTYYFYNVLEELDAPGEWYLDREAWLLYLWPPADDFDNARVDLSLSTKTLVTGENLKNLGFVGLTLQCTRGSGIGLSGDSLLVDHCLVQNLAGTGVSVAGYNNTVSDCEVRHVGREGIGISGGDQATLTPGNNKAVNNLVHDWPEIFMAYNGGIRISGTDNLAAHNELYNSPHTAIFFNGNNHVIEYNLIHDVCLETDDAGAIYDGRSFFNSWGTVIRYNLICNLGSRSRTPNGVYLDDGLSGVSVLNNLLINVPGLAIVASGGRDLAIQGNVAVNAGEPIHYNQSRRDGALATDPNAFAYEATGPGGSMLRALEGSPWQTDIWKEAYPELAVLSTDHADIEEPSFAANPANSSVTGNAFVGSGKPSYAESVLRFSEIGPNKSYGAWRMRGYRTLPEYESIPLERIGRKAG